MQQLVPPMPLPDLDNYHIGIDLDHTTYNPLPSICTAVNEQYGTNLTPQEITAYNLPIPGSDDKISKVIHELHEDETFIQNMELMPGSIDAIKAFTDAGATISIVTHRDPATFTWARQSLDANNIPYDHFVKNVPDNKADLKNIDILIDDLPTQLKGMAHTDRHGILFLRPYNITNIPAHTHIHSPLRNGHTKAQLLANPATQWAEIQTIIKDITS